MSEAYSTSLAVLRSRYVLVAASSALASVQRATLVIGGGLAITLTCLIAVLTPSLRTVSVKLDETEADIS